MRVVVEIVQELREDAHVSGITKGRQEEEEDDDDDMADIENEVEAALRGDAPAEDVRRIKFAEQTLDSDKGDLHLRCLSIVRALLERVVGVRICLYQQSAD